MEYLFKRAGLAVASGGFSSEGENKDSVEKTCENCYLQQRKHEYEPNIVSK